MAASMKHIKASLGPDVNLNKFYITQYSSTYGKQWENFTPRKTRHYGTGYLSNFRPGVYYSRGLDLRDNPPMANIISANYNTITKMDYGPWVENSGREPLPRGMYQNGSGFVREKPLTVADYKQVNGVHIDTRVRPQTMDTVPRHVPLLHQINCRDPVELENTRYGPASMSTETKQRFRGLPTDHVDRSTKVLGPLTESGFTHNKNIGPVTFHHDYAHKNDYPAWLTDRPIGRSVTKTTFVPLEGPDSCEKFGEIIPRSNRGSGFTKDTHKPAYLRKPTEAYDNANDIPAPRLEQIKKMDPVGYLNNIHPNNNSSVASCHWTGQQHPSKTMPDILDRTDVGDKTDTGYTVNNDRFVFTADNVGRFVTDNNVRFVPPLSRTHLEAPWVRGNIQDRKEDGFTKSTLVHAKTLGDEPNSTDTLRSLEPYVARSIKVRDRFNDDHTYDHKMSTSSSSFMPTERSFDQRYVPELQPPPTQRVDPYVIRNQTAPNPCHESYTASAKPPLSANKLKKTVTFSCDQTRAYTTTEGPHVVAI